MIWLDVTSAAGSPLNTGVQRVLREIFRLLEGGCVPVRWDFRRRRYARLSPREEGLLRAPFARHRRASFAPEFVENYLTPRALLDALARGRRGVPWAAVAGNTLLVPDVCWDARVYEWKNFPAIPGRRVAIFHDAMPLRVPARPGPPDRLFLKYVRELARFDRVLCVSNEVEADLLDCWRREDVAPAQTAVLPWPVPFSDPRPESPPSFAARKLLHVARLKLRKNQILLLDACEALWREGLDFSLELIGTADMIGETSRILLRLGELRARGRPAVWRGHVSDDELKRAYLESSFTVFPSKMEGFGLPILESLWFGRPVICGRNGVLGEVSAGGGCLQINQNDAGELAAAIRCLLTDEAEWMRLHREASRRHFRTWEDYGRELAAELEPQ